MSDSQRESMESCYASQSALNFLTSINETDLKNVIYPEILETLDENDNVIGEYSVKMNMVQYSGNEAISVVAVISGIFNGVQASVDVSAIVSPHNLATLEQKVTEHALTGSNPIDRVVIVKRDESGYRATKTSSKLVEITKTINISSAVGLVLEGSNLILQRLLIRKGIEDDFILPTLDSNLNVVPSYYKSLESKRKIAIDGNEYTVAGLERIVMEDDNNVPLIWHIYGLSNGMIMDRIQIGHQDKMRLAKLPLDINDLEVYIKPTFTKKVLDWRQDLQLKNKKLDIENQLTRKYASFLQENEGIQQLLSLFLENVLTNKPEDVFEAAAKFFSFFKHESEDVKPFKEFSEKSNTEDFHMTEKIVYLCKKLNKL